MSLASNCEVKTYLYPESNHNLADCPMTEFDILTKTVLFIESHVLKSEKLDKIIDK